MDSFFDSRQEYGYKARSIGLLDYSSETILEELKRTLQESDLYYSFLYILLLVLIS